ncbi:uncharacterized protein [Venturia canescens]|uniref:uncharacterized protein n=1 Tax=Venturia canescens TaxID=32260 RepID=UPI001C9CDFD1|nr:uncharacterized protein LOC122418419 [Venturia canescens]
MENYGETQFETKIETFDPCMINVSTSQEVIQSSDQARVTEAAADAAEMEENTEDDSFQEEMQHQPTGQIATIQSNAMTNMTLTPVRLPALLDGEFFSVVRVEDTNVTVQCLQCKKLLNGNLKSTGNFLSHIKRVHPFMIERIKCKTHQRKPAIAYVDMTTGEKSTDIVKTKRVYRKCYKADENQNQNTEETTEQTQNWAEPSTIIKRRKYDEVTSFPESTEQQTTPQSNSFVIQDEFDAIGRNVAAKLRNMRLDQRIIAEKLLNDVLFEAQLGTLHRDSSLHV